MNLLICPGMARGGTTYLYHNLVKSNPAKMNESHSKELNFFGSNNDPETFKSFFPDAREDAYYLDFSPSYLVYESAAVNNIIGFPAANKKIIIHLRNPVDQLFAHYMHDVNTHYANREFGNVVKCPLFSWGILKNYMAIRSPAIDRLVKAVGRENVFVVNFHTDIGSSDLHTRLSAFLGIDLAPFDTARIGGGGWMPHYIYSGDDKLDVVVQDEICALPPEHLLLVNNQNSEVWPDIDYDEAGVLLAGASTWTREILPYQYDMIYQALEEDWNKILNTLQQSADDYVVPKHLVAKPAVLPESMKEKLKPLRTLPKLLQNASSIRGVQL